MRTDVDSAWSAITDRYVYLTDKAVDWPKAKLIADIAADSLKSKPALLTVLERLLDNLYDAHATPRANSKRSHRLVPSGLDVWAEWEGPDAIVTSVRDGYSADQAGIRPGMRVLAINGVPVASAADFRIGPAVIHPVPRQARQWALLSALAGTHDTPRVLTVRDEVGRVIDVPLDQPTHRLLDATPLEPLVERRRMSTVSSRPAPGRDSAASYGYIRLNALGDIGSVAAFDSALDALRDTKGLVLDLRNTPSGGSTDIAEPIMGRLISRAAGYQRVVPRSGGGYVRIVEARGPWTYMAPVVVLVGRWTGSMGEGMAIGLDAIGRAKIVGTRMAGLAGAVDDFTLPCSKIGLAFPTARLLHINGTARDQWVPPVLVDLVAAEANWRDAGLKDRAPRDEVLARGLSLLAESTKH